MEALHTAVLILHVLGATIIIGIAFVTFIIEIKHFTTKQISQLVSYLWKLAGITIGIQLLTGLYLAGSEWDHVGKSPYFWIKMFLFFVIGGTVGSISHRRFREAKENKVPEKTLVTLSLLGLLTFATIAVLGVMIAETAGS